MRFLRSSTLLCLALFSGISARAAQSPAVDAQSREAETTAKKQRDEARKLALGRSVFVNNCAACHGNEGHGHGVARIALTRRPPDLTDSDIGDLGDEYLLTAVGNGRRSMPSFDKILNEEQEQAVVAYVISLSAHQNKGSEDKTADQGKRGEK